MNTPSFTHDPSFASDPRASFAHDHGGPASDETNLGGRPNGYTPSALSLLQSVIRETGISDSGAAKRLGMSTSTVSRWKMEQPELKIGLLQAREEFRVLKLDKVLKAAEAEEGRGWRAAAWLLERVFPGDYAMRPGDRYQFQQIEARAEEEEMEQATRCAEAESVVKRRLHEAKGRELQAEVEMLELELRKRELSRQVGTEESKGEENGNENESGTASHAEGDSHSSQNPSERCSGAGTPAEETEQPPKNESAAGISIDSEAVSHLSQNPATSSHLVRDLSPAHAASAEARL